MSVASIQNELLGDLLKDNELLSNRIYQKRSEIMDELTHPKVMESFLKKNEVSSESKEVLKKFLEYQKLFVEWNMT